MDIRSISSTSPVKTAEIVPAVAPVSLPANGARPSLDPAVQIELSAEARDAAPNPSAQTPQERERFTRDPDTQALVFQVVDGDGAVVVQLPDENALRARAYLREELGQTGRATDRTV